MTTSRERILELVSSGKITPAEGEQLLGALKPPGSARSAVVLGWLFNPLERLGTGVSLGLSLAAAGAGLFLASAGVHFDGTLDVHQGTHAVPPPRALMELAVAWPLSALVFWAAARAGGRGTRAVDMFAAVGLARIPLTLTGLVTALFVPPFDPKALQDGLPLGHLHRLLLSAAAILPLIGIAIAMLVLGYRTASGIKGPRLVFSFLGGLVAAEVLSKVVLALVP